MTAGSQCNPAVRDKVQHDRTFGRVQMACAWPARLERWLQEQVGASAVSVTNLAKGAHATAEWASLFDGNSSVFVRADLIVAEHSVNDQHIVNEGASRFHVKAASAVLFQAMLALPQKPAVLFGPPWYAPKM